jgi:anti-sigma B factor antagonist
MDVKITEHVVRVVVVAPQERVDAFNATELRAELERLSADGATNLVMDLSAVPFLDSAGLAALVSALKRSRLAGGDVKLVWPKEKAAQRILSLTKFDRVFDWFESTEEAVEAF